MIILKLLGNIFSVGAVTQTSDGRWVGAVWVPNSEHASGVGNGPTPEASIEAAKQDYRVSVLYATKVFIEEEGTERT